MLLKCYNLVVVLLFLLGGYGSVQVVIVFDCICLVFCGEDKLISVDLKNVNSKLFYLVQFWVEDEKGVKIILFLIVVLLVQCIELLVIGQVKIQGMLVLVLFFKDWEIFFYYNVCEILL